MSSQSQALDLSLPTPPTHFPRARRQARPVHVARARTRSTRARPRGLSGDGGGGGRRAQLHPQVSSTPPSSCSAAPLRRLASLRFIPRPRRGIWPFGDERDG
jgi:hypothetical protein